MRVWHASVSQFPSRLIVPAAVALVLLAAGARAQFGPSLPAPLAPTLPGRARHDPHTITVKFRAGVGLARIDDVVAAMGGQVDYVSYCTPGLRTVTVPPRFDVWATVAQYRQRADVEYAEPTYLSYPDFTPNDPLYPRQWNFGLIRLAEAWRLVPSRGSRSVIVAVLDTGVAYETCGDYVVAPDLAGVHFVSARDFADPATVDPASHPNDEGGHGTHVTGTIAQCTNNKVGVAGIADGVSIMPVRVLGGQNGGKSVVISDGVHWAVDHGAHILNCSCGGPDWSQTLEDAFTYAHDRGVLAIASAGNGHVNDPNYPSGLPKVMAVAAVDKEGKRASYSKVGKIDVAAPGGVTGGNTANPNGIVQNTFPESHPKQMGYLYFQGTSMAAPHVSGLAALLWSQGRCNTADAVRERIERTCRDLGVPGKDSWHGWGLIDAGAALGSRAPVVSWAGTKGFEQDGVNPDQGRPNDTEFEFRVKVTDSDGDRPTVAKVHLWRWTTHDTGENLPDLPMTPGAGDIRTGRIYTAKTRLGNYPFLYWFTFADHDGAAVGDPGYEHRGPDLIAPPVLSWMPGWGPRGASKSAGPPGTVVNFGVGWLDSSGDDLTAKTVEIRLDGRPYKTLELESDRLLSSWYTDYTLRDMLTLTRVGTYTCRFRLADVSGWATGPPAAWHTAVVIRKPAAPATAVASLVALPSPRGAQVTLSLSQPASATATVYNLAGRPIRVLARDRALPAGAHTLLWDRRSDAGLLVPAGTYLIRLQANAAQGGTTTALATLALR